MEYDSNEDHLRNPFNTTKVYVFRQMRTKLGPFYQLLVTVAFRRNVVSGISQSGAMSHVLILTETKILSHIWADSVG